MEKTFKNLILATFAIIIITLLIVNRYQTVDTYQIDYTYLGEEHVVIVHSSTKPNIYQTILDCSGEESIDLQYLTIKRVFKNDTPAPLEDQILTK